ncbi:thyrotropin receptor-like [Oculina patagonica]
MFSFILTIRELSQNLLEELVSNSFSGLANLLKLSLKYNNIKVIHKDAFSGLYSLQTLNLTGNSLQLWNTRGATLHLPSLMIIDVQGNMGWRPEEKYLLELPRLKEVRNVSWAAECLDCWLIKNVSEDEIKIFNNSLYNLTGPDSCITYHYTLSDFLVLLARHRFLVRECKSLSNCLRQKETNSTISHSCWHVTQRVISGQLFFGILGGCLNLVVFFNILLTRTLRKNVSLVLVSHLALGDTLSCLYSVAIASIIVSNPYSYLHHISDSLCPKVGSLWILGQCTTSITSVALTLERYLCIVFSMKPDIRMTPRLASRAIAFNWIVAASLMSAALYLKMYRRNYLCIPIIYDENLPNETRYTIAMGSIGIILYLVTIPLYVHIYLVVKRSSQQMGVQRESTLAKRIAVLVGTNLVFFFMPVLSLGAWMILIKSSNENISIYSRSAVEEWIPLYCLSVNSCLNPLVHAFRNDKFKQALRKILPFTCNTSRVTPATQENSSQIDQ